MPDEVKATAFLGDAERHNATAVTPTVTPLVTPTVTGADDVTPTVTPGQPCPTCGRRVPLTHGLRQKLYRERHPNGQ